MKSKELLLMYIIILLVGCARIIETTERNPEVVKPSFLPLIEEEPLIHLKPKEFEKEYEKLSGDYKIKMNNKELFEKVLLYNKHHKTIKLSEDGTITKKQAEKVNKVYTYEGRTSRDTISLKELRYFRNLEHMGLYQCNVSELNELKYLDNLKYLMMNNCNLSSLDFLNECQNMSLVDIEFGENQITDISPLSNMKELYWIFLHDNQITDISPLAGLKKLEVLDLSKNRLKEIPNMEILSGNKSINLLLSDNQIDNITALSNLKNLVALELNNNQITDITSLSNLRVVSWISLANNPITDISPLKNVKIDDVENGKVDLTNTNIDFNLAKKMFGRYLTK